MHAISSKRSVRITLRASPAQEMVLRRAADVGRKSLSDFILESACQAAEQTLLDQRLFVVSASQFESFTEILDRPEQENPGLRKLLTLIPPWAKN